MKYLKEAPRPEVRELFRQVGSDAHHATEEGQNPTFYAPLGESDVYLASEPLMAEEDGRRRLALEPGKKFRDCPECPEMVVVPGGTIGLPLLAAV